jgi:hypothetical protein
VNGCMDLCVEIVFGPESGNNSGLNIALETGGAVVEWVVNIHIKVKRKTLNTEVEDYSLQLCTRLSSESFR